MLSPSHLPLSVAFQTTFFGNVMKVKAVSLKAVTCMCLFFLPLCHIQLEVTPCGCQDFKIQLLSLSLSFVTN